MILSGGYFSLHKIYYMFKSSFHVLTDSLQVFFFFFFVITVGFYVNKSSGDYLGAV